MRMPNNASTVGRGIYRLPFLNADGRGILVAIGSDGRLVQQATVFRRDQVSDVTRMLRRILDREDPARQVES